MDKKIVAKIKKYRKIQDELDAYGVEIIRDLNIPNLSKEELNAYRSITGQNYITMCLIDEIMGRIGK